MMYNKRKYYLTSTNNKIYIIEGEDLNVVNAIEVEPRPQDIVLYKNKLYVASDRENIINVIENNEIIDKLYIKNNGKININLKTNEIYICNTDIVEIYNLNVEKIKTLKGFRAAYKIKFNKQLTKAFILDILSNEIKSYDVEKKEFIKSYKNIGETPIDFFVSENEDFIYILNKGIDGVKFLGYLISINILNQEIYKIDFEVGSILNNMDNDREFIYITNQGLKRIDIVNINKKNIIDNLKVTLDTPTFIKKDKENLLVISEDNFGKSVLDVIDIKNKNIKKSLDLAKNNIKANNINILYECENEEIIEEKIKKEINLEDNEIINDKIIIKRVVSEYKQRIIFNKVAINTKNIKDIENIDFEKWEINKEKTFKQSSNKENYIDVKFEFVIPYNISGFTENNKKRYIKGNIRRVKNINIFLDNYKIEEVEFNIKSNTKIVSEPIINDEYIYLDMISIISIFTVVEEYLSLHSYISLMKKI